MGHPASVALTCPAPRLLARWGSEKDRKLATACAVLASLRVSRVCGKGDSRIREGRLRAEAEGLFADDFDEDAVGEFAAEEMDDTVFHVAFEDLTGGLGGGQGGEARDGRGDQIAVRTGGWCACPA